MADEAPKPKASRPGMPDRPRGRERHAARGSTVAADQPVVAVVGYPNVGKSTLFNRLTGRREAVVDSMAGVTRDRRQGGAEWNGRQFQILDTGGIDDADESVVVVDDGDGEEVVAGELLHHLVARLLDADADRVLLHEVADEGIRAGEDQVAKRNEADQMAIAKALVANGFRVIPPPMDTEKKTPAI
jgi:ribosome-interacting GTPase 1